MFVGFARAHYGALITKSAQHSALILIARVLITRRLVLSAAASAAAACLPACLARSLQAVERAATQADGRVGPDRAACLPACLPAAMGSCNSKRNKVSTFVHYSDRLPDLRPEEMYGIANGCFFTWKGRQSDRCFINLLHHAL